MSDREKLIELIEQAKEKAKGTLGSMNNGFGAWYADYLLANGVIVQKQGEWIQTKEPLGWHDVDCVECSVCHESWICDEDFDFEFCKETWKYCPACGVKMEVKERGNNGNL